MNLLEARHDFDEVALPASEPADHFRRTLTDAKVVAGLSRVELAQNNIIPAWLRRFGAWLSDYPARLEHAGQTLEVGVDIAETLHGGWRKFKKEAHRRGLFLAARIRRRSSGPRSKAWRATWDDGAG